jgi:hypothetical protein
MREVFAPHLNRNIKLGGLRHRRQGLVHLHFSDFVTHAKLPTIPTVFDFTPKALVPLTDIYGNDSMGDCAIAMMFHLAGLFTGNAGQAAYHATLAQIIAAYSRIGGYRQGDPSTDNGCVLTDVLTDWKTHGLPNGQKILGYISVNASNWNDVVAAAYLFENLCFGVGLPDKWIAPFPSKNGFTWGVAGNADSNNGHAFAGCGGTTSGVGAGIKIDTWGLFGNFTPDGIAAYAGTNGGGELWSVVTQDMVDKASGKAGNGLALADLIKAFDSMGGNVPVPAPPPPAPPAPTPGGVTLAQAQAWAAAGLQSGPWLISKDAAINNVKRSLQGSWPK